MTQVDKLTAALKKLSAMPHHGMALHLHTCRLYEDLKAPADCRDYFLFVIRIWAL